MIFGCVVEALVGSACIILGLLLWKKQMVKLLHDYHYKNVLKKDIPAYTKQVGIGLILIGAGILVTGVLNLFYSPWWWVPLVLGLVSGFTVLYKAQKKYNGSVLGSSQKEDSYERKRIQRSLGNTEQSAGGGQEGCAGQIHGLR